jgi:hypothetical protein
VPPAAPALADLARGAAPRRAAAGDALADLQAVVARTLAAAKRSHRRRRAPAPPCRTALRELPQSAREALDQLRRAYAPHQK